MANDTETPTLDAHVAAERFRDECVNGAGQPIDATLVRRFLRDHWGAVAPLLLAMGHGEPEPQQPETEKAEQPNFQSGIVTQSPALIVDIGGKAWWVDPLSQKIKRAEAR